MIENWRNFTTCGILLANATTAQLCDLLGGGAETGEDGRLLVFMGRETLENSGIVGGSRKNGGNFLNLSSDGAMT